MSRRSITPLAAFDVSDGEARPVQEDWPTLTGPSAYRWLHFDLATPELEPWSREHLPQIADQALRQAETRPRCTRLDDGLILNLRGVNLNPDSDPEDMVSLRMWVTGDAIVTARVRKVWVLDAMRETAVSGSAPATVGDFLAELAQGLTKRIEEVSLALEERTDNLEEAMATGQGLGTEDLTALRQTVIKLRRFIHPQREAISDLAALDDWSFAAEDLALLRETANRTRRIVEALDATRDRLSALQDHVEAERTQALSRNSYVLSIVAAIFLPLGFLTGLFGVNLAGMPGTVSPYAFWSLTVASVAVGVALFAIFKLSKWL